MAHTLVAYFSATGTTARVAQQLAKAADADLFEIRPEEPYTSADLNWNDKHSRSSIEMNDDSSRPALASTVEDLGSYDTVFVGFPIWWYEEPRIIDTFLEAHDFAGKTVIPFATSGGSSMGRTLQHFQALCPGATTKAGKRLEAGATAASLKGWVDGVLG